jgi:hypothetical protein
MVPDRFKGAIVGAVGAIGLLAGFGVAPARALPLLLNPSASNGGTSPCTSGGTPCQISPKWGTFPVSQADLIFTSDLQIQSGYNAAGSIYSTETGSFLFTDWGAAYPQGLLSDYNIYGTFQIDGFGTWNGTGTYTLSTPTFAVINLYANPGGAGGAVDAPTFTQATQTGGPGVTSNNPNDFLLATATVTGFTASGVPIATFTGGGATASGEDLGVVLGLVPTANTTGLNGFWQNVLAGGLNLFVTATNGSSGTEVIAGLQGLNTDGCPVASCADLKTKAQFFASGGTPPSHGNGSVTFLVPEPGTLGLLGSALIFLGAMRLRRRES